MTQYTIKDKVWIHLGEKNLVEGRVVEIIDLQHLGENYGAEDLYIIEVPTHIDPVYEVRSFDTISADARGPINLFRKQNQQASNRFTKQLGMPLPQGAMDFEHPEPSVDEINAAMDRSHDATKHTPLSEKRPSKKRTYFKKKSVKPT
jgi:hypothetical protein